MTERVGVDIGATGVRVVRVNGIDRDGFAIVTAAGIAPLRRDAVRAGRIREKEAVSLALTRALEAAGVNPRKTPLVVGISTPETSVTQSALPSAIKPAERVQVIRDLGRPVSPAVPLETAALSVFHMATSQMVGEGAGTSDHLVIGSVLDEQIDTLRDIAKLAKVKWRAIDCAPAATMRAVARSRGSQAEIATIVDVGASKIAVLTRQGLHARSLRVMNGGGDDMTDAIVSASDNDTYKDAEDRKLTMTLSDAPRDELVQLDRGYGLDESGAAHRKTPIEETLMKSVNPLLDVIAQAIENDANLYNSVTGSVTLCGGTAMMRGFRQLLSGRLGVEVRVGGPWARLERNKYTEAYFAADAEDPRLMLVLATAIGLGLWEE